MQIHLPLPWLPHGSYTESLCNIGVIFTPPVATTDWWGCSWYCNNVIIGTMASQITSLTIDYSIVYSSADHRKHQSSASLAFVRGIHRRPMNSPHKWPVTPKKVPFEGVIMRNFVFNVGKIILNNWKVQCYALKTVELRRIILGGKCRLIVSNLVNASESFFHMDVRRGSYYKLFMNSRIYLQVSTV